MVERISPLMHFEVLGDLYHRRYGRLRPGKSEAPEAYRDSNSEENVAQYAVWFRFYALSDAVSRIVELEKRVNDLENGRD